MYYLFKKMGRDLWLYKGQFLSVFVMTFLCIFIFSGIEGLWNSMETNSESYFKETNLADVWVTTKSMNNDKVKEIEKIHGVEAVDLQAIANGNVLDGGKSADFQIISSKNNNVSILRVIDGEKYQSSQSGAWIDSFYADAMNLKVGDTINVKAINNVKNIKISGIVMDSEYIGYTGSGSATPTDHEAYGYLVVGDELFKSLVNSNINYNQIKIKFQKNVNSKHIRKEITNILGDNMISYTDRETNPNITYFTNKIQSIKQVSIFFSFIFLLLALLTIYSTISRLVDSQRIQIGTLTAIGFSKKQILLHYLSYGTLISLIGTVVGYMCSFFLGKMLITSQQKFHTMPTWDIPISAISMALIIIIIIICSLGSLLASYKLIVSSPALIMKNQNPLSLKKERTINIPFLGYEWNWVIRDLIRAKLRLFIGSIGVLGSIVLVLSAIGLKDSVQYSNKYIYGTVFSYTSKVNVNNVANINSIEELDGSKGQWIQEDTVDLEIKDSIETTSIVVIDKGHFVNLDEKNPLNLEDEEIVITKKLADRLNVKLNNNISMRSSPNSPFKKYKISKIIDIPFPQGLYTSSLTWKNHSNEFIPSSYLTGISISKNKNKDILSVTTLKDQLKSTDEIMKSIYSVIMAMIFASILLSIVILYNLGMLKFVERTKEYSTLKVLGFKNSELFKLVFYDSVPPLIIGCSLGLIIGASFMSIFVSLVSTNVRAYLPHLMLSNIILSLLIVITCTLFVDYIVFRKIKKLNLVESLKSSE